MTTHSSFSSKGTDPVQKAKKDYGKGDEARGVKRCIKEEPQNQEPTVKRYCGGITPPQEGESWFKVAYGNIPLESNQMPKEVSWSFLMRPLKGRYDAPVFRSHSMQPRNRTYVQRSFSAPVHTSHGQESGITTISYIQDHLKIVRQENLGVVAPGDAFLKVHISFELSK
uniref:Uncharacterized protein n=1 Tax=Caenorhabditis tropicalis TaxID=1561998 RepID=A0A1I7UIH7_9PELO